MAALSSYLKLCTFILLHSFAESAFQVPVFMWSKDSELNDATPVLAGHTIKGSDFQEKYLDRLFEVPQLICLFLQDRLSIDDISYYGDAYSPGNSGAAFSNLKFAMETANSSVVLPSVEATSVGETDELVNLIRRKTDGRLTLEFSPQESLSFDIKEIPLHQGKTNVLIFHLLPSSSSNPEDIFAQNDKLIGMITQQISSSGLPYSCILTASAPNEDVETRHVAEERSYVAHDRLRRDVKEEIPVGGNRSFVFVNADCILLYTKGIVFQYNERSYDIFNNMTGLEYSSSGVCANDFEHSVSIKFKMENVSTFDLRFVFSLISNNSRSDWSCSEATLEVNGMFGTEHIQQTFFYDNCRKVLTAPSKYSYSCGRVTLKTENSSLSFKQFQVQPFDVPINSTSFSYAYDCTGFFTIPILMGLFTAAILLVILFCGVIAMLSMTTMDRFDDPKGPTIHVPTG